MPCFEEMPWNSWRYFTADDPQRGEPQDMRLLSTHRPVEAIGRHRHNGATHARSVRHRLRINANIFYMEYEDKQEEL